MKGEVFGPCQPDQLLMLTPSKQECLPAGHAVCFVSYLVGSLDLSAILETGTEERGYLPHRLLMMTKLPLYGRVRGIRGKSLLLQLYSRCPSHKTRRPRHGHMRSWPSCSRRYGPEGRGGARMDRLGTQNLKLDEDRRMTYGAHVRGPSRPNAGLFS